MGSTWSGIKSAWSKLIQQNCLVAFELSEWISTECLMSHGCGTSGSIFCCLEESLPYCWKFVDQKKVGLGACRARNTENISLIAGENLFFELVIRELHENYAVRKDTERGMSRFKKAALLLMNENRIWVCLILQTCPRVTPLRDIKNTALNTLLHWFYQGRGDVASDCYSSKEMCTYMRTNTSKTMSLSEKLKLSMSRWVWAICWKFKLEALLMNTV